MHTQVSVCRQVNTQVYIPARMCSHNLGDSNSRTHNLEQTSRPCSLLSGAQLDAAALTGLLGQIDGRVQASGVPFCCGFRLEWTGPSPGLGS
jgi:hypothetical protein